MIHLQKAFVLLSFFCSTLLLNAQTSTEKWDQYSEIAFANIENKKFVDKILINEKGFSAHSAVIENIVKKAKDSKTYLIRVKKKGKFGWANVSGELIIPIEYDGGTFGLMPNGLICAIKREKWGCIDFKNTIIVPFIYDNILPFKDGYSQVTSNGKMGFVNTAGVEIIKPVYDKIEPFLNGAAVVMKDNKYGFINTKGTILGDISYDGAFSFDEHKFGYIKIGTKYGVIDSTGKLLFSDEFQEVIMALNSELFKVRKNFSYGVMTKTGKLVIDYKYMSVFKPRPDGNGSVSNVSEIILRVRCGALWGFVKGDGTIVSECVFSNAEEVYMGQAQVEMHADAVTKKGTYYFDKKRFQVDVEVPDPVVVEPPSNSHGGNSSNVKAEKTLKNTGKDILYYKAGTFTSSLGGGNSTSVPCRQAIYYVNDDGNGHHTVKGSLISGENEDCGQTVTAVGGN